MRLHDSLKRRRRSSRLHGVTYQKTVIFNSQNSRSCQSLHQPEGLTRPDLSSLPSSARNVRGSVSRIPPTYTCNGVATHCPFRAQCSVDGDRTVLELSARTIWSSISELGHGYSITKAQREV
jgi:hypothetical protein